MMINEVKTAEKIGSFVLDNEGNLHLIYTVKDRSILTDNSPRVYIFTSNGVIKKIGGSGEVGGIKATLSFYVYATSGSPGSSRYIVHNFIKEELKAGKKVDVYLIIGNKNKIKIPGLFKFDEKITETSSFKEMEKLALEDYYSREGKYPDWNFQENREKYPHEIYNDFLSYHKKRNDKYK